MFRSIRQVLRFRVLLLLSGSPPSVNYGWSYFLPYGWSYFHMDSPTDKNPPDSGLLRLITDGPTDKSPGPFFGPADCGPWTFLWHSGLDLVAQNLLFGRKKRKAGRQDYSSRSVFRVVRSIFSFYVLRTLNLLKGKPRLIDLGGDNEMKSERKRIKKSVFQQGQKP